MSDWIYWEQITWGYFLPGNDIIKVIKVEDGTPGTIEFVFQSAPVITWAKGLTVVDSPVWHGGAWTVGDDHGPRSFVVQVIPALVDNAALESSKAAFLGIQTGYYKVGHLRRYENKKVTIEWQWDWWDVTADGYTRPEWPTPPVDGA